MKKSLIKTEQLLEMLDNLATNEVFIICYDRVVPKCSNCGAKKTKKWVDGIETCPNCGGIIDYDKKALGVRVDGNGIDKNCYRYFDRMENDFRHCRIENIKSSVIDDTEYLVINI